MKKLKFLPFLLGILPMLLFSLEVYSFEITKGAQDKKSYRLITLENRMQVLLISDPDTDEAAASMNIQTGSFNDPKDRPGLTHFLEHMLFLGTDKFPTPSEYSGFLANHGGGSNAYTGQENTNYHFYIDKRHLTGALARFSRFFIAPLFNENFVQREVNAVHAEHQKNLRSDERRIFQVLKETANSEHPYNSFSTGDKNTLNSKPGIRKALIQYYNRYYSANLMQLAVLGQESLDELETMVSKFFREVPDKNAPLSNWSQPVIKTEELPRMVYIKPVQNIHRLTIKFPIPAQTDYYHEKSGGYLGHLLGDEGPGSVFSYLKEKGLATSLSAGGGSGSRSYGFFNLRLNLTEKGISKINDILQAVFTYIAKIKYENGITEWRYREMQSLARIDFDWQEKQNPYHLTRYLSSRIGYLKTEDILTGDLLYFKYDPTHIKSILALLKPENMQLEVVTKNAPVNMKDPWYQAEYSVKPLNKTITAKLNKALNDKSEKTNFTFPVKNPYIPTKIQLARFTSTPKKPELVLDSDKLRLWYYPDYQFHQPKVSLKAEISSPIAYDHPKHAAMTKLLLNLWQDKINEKIYPFYIAGGGLSVSHQIEGLGVSAFGYLDTLKVILPEVLKTLENFDITIEKFELHKKQLIRNYRNQKQSQPVADAGYHAYYILSSPLWHRDDYLAAIPEVQKEDLLKFRTEFLEALKIRMFIHGNATKDQAIELSELISSWQKNKVKEEGLIAKKSWLNITPGTERIFTVTTQDKNSAVTFYSQLPENSLKTKLKINLLAQLLSEPIYTQLRTIEQLGYIVSSYPMNNEVNSGFSVVIQSPVQSPAYLQKRIENFFIRHQEKINELSDQTFLRVKNTILNQLKEPYQKRSELNGFLWGEIMDRTYRFHYKKQAFDELSKIDKMDVIRLYEKLFIQSKKRRLIVRVNPDQYPAKKGEVYTLEQLKQFKSNANYLLPPKTTTR